MSLVDLSCEEFVADTFSKAPVPGGGSVAALVGSLGTALEGMVCSLTQGKKQYSHYEADIVRIAEKVQCIKEHLLHLVEEDAQNFYPLSQVYGMRADTPEEAVQKEEKMQEALKIAVTPPIQLIQDCYQAVQFLEELSEKGSKLALSDVGCGAQLLRSALLSGWMNVLVNLNSITDKEFTESCRAQLLPMVENGCQVCDKVYEKVLQLL